jgi:Ca2+-binding RTX toxin-like protein
VDTVDYLYASSGISLTLGGYGDGIAYVSSSDVDTLSNIENIIGSGYSDSIVGDFLANVLGGDTGDDSLLGGDGSDTLIGGAGNDLLKGDVPLSVSIDLVEATIDTGHTSLALIAS